MAFTSYLIDDLCEEMLDKFGSSDILELLLDATYF
jgi:hypothetical protein